MEKLKTQILVVDDEEDLCEILRFNLEKDGYSVETAHSAEEALKLDVASKDLIILDVMMGGMSGFDMAKQLKTQPQTKQIPIIFLTALDTEDDAIKGFDLGADDYLYKPFSIRELMVRIRAILRRSKPQEEWIIQKHLVYDGISVDIDKKLVIINGKEVVFTKTEFLLLCAFLSNPKRVYSRQELINLIWKEGVYVQSRTIDVHIRRMRIKLGPYADHIATRSGFGYYFAQ